MKIKRIIIKNFLLLIVFSIVTDTLAQTNSSTELKLPDFIPSAPSAYELTKYGSIPVNESTGIASLSIPLVTYNTQNLSLPVSLSYSSSGVKVDQVASNVGMSWSINAGGVITRNTRGLPDNIGASRSYPTLSYIQGLKNGNSSQQALFYQFVEDVNGEVPEDWQPDLFNFNINGYSGTFFFDQNNDIHMVKKDVEVDIEYNNGFIITTPEGISYHFTETETSRQRSSGIPSPTTMYISAWYATKIKHYKGDEIVIEYENANNTLFYMGSLSQTEVKYTNLSTGCQGNGDQQGLTNSISKQVNYNYTNEKKIKKISSNQANGYVEFVTSESRSDLEDSYKIQKVELYNSSNQLIKGYELDYTFYKSTLSYSTGAQTWSGLNGINSNHENYYRMFLTGIKEYDKFNNFINGKEHAFQYENPQGLPPRLSLAQDYLGFYNGKNSNAGLLPDTYLTSDSFFLMNRRGDRSSDFNYAKKGLLTKVTYPTKGTTELFYEGANYPLINKIVTKESSTAAEEVTKYYYKSYTSAINGTGGTSYYSYAPLYDDIIIDMDVNEGCGSHHVTKFNSSSITNLYINSTNQFLYKTVTVGFGNNFEKGGIEKRFYVESDDDATTLFGSLIKSGARSNTEVLNGTLLKETYLKNNSGTLEEQKIKEYVYLNDLSKQTIVDSYKGNRRYENIANVPGPGVITSVWGYDLAHYITSSNWVSIDSIKTYDYLNGKTFTQIEDYNYESGFAGLPSTIITNNSNGLNNITKKYYPDDIINSSFLPGDNLTSPQYTAVSKLKSNQTHRFEVVQTDYKQGSGVLRRQRINYDLWGTSNIALPESIEAHKGDYSSATNKLEERITYHEYYNNGNVKEVSMTDGLPIVYIWGYKEQYPIAKIENATFTSGKSNTISGSQQTLINNAVAAATNETTAGTENTLRTKLQLLRDGFPKAMVTTFTYNPLEGVTSITDPRGQTVYYEYDDFNRLKLVKDKNSKILSQNEYHYKN